MDAIHDHAILGDGRSAALVTRGGTIDWLCWPRFDSPALFASILDDRAGHFSLAPRGPFEATRAYVENTNVLRTTFRTPGGVLVLTDLMPVASEDDKRRRLVPENEILRIAECTEGAVELELDYAPRPGFATERPRFTDAGPLGLRAETRQGLLALRTDIDLVVDDDSARGVRRLRAGEAAHASLTFAGQWPAVLPPLGDASRQAVERSVAWWRAWLSRCTYDGPRRDAVLRSALVLKLLVHAPSGAVVAAPTTSLPERAGGDLNWDYRFCWLRDAAMTVRALFGLGFREEGEAFVSWLLHATSLSWPALRILYDVYGNRPPRERVLDHLAGHRGARPVRTGNAAAAQLQLDVYGEVIDAAARFLREGGVLDRDTRRMLCSLGAYVCRNWQRPDEGIWEPRSGSRHRTHSRVLCWVALERLLELHGRGHLDGAPVAEFARNREAIRAEVEARGWNEALGAYVAELDGADVDASTLLLPWFGFEDAASPRMRATRARIRERLGAPGGLLYRYRSPDSAGEGAFGICGFWDAEYLARGGGTADEARALFERLCDHANDVGLFAEEIDPETGAALGNFPQAFTHVGLVNAALSLARRLGHAEARR